MSRKFALLIPCISTIAILIALCISLNYSGDALAAPPAAAPLEPAAPSWRISCLDCPPAFLPSGDRYLKLDPSGAPHMVFTGDGQLYHAWRAAGGWEVELIWVPYIIEPQLPVSVTSAALAFDSQGNLHIAYILSEIGDSVLYLYTQAPGMITYEIVAAFVDADGTVTGLEIDSAGYARIPYYDSAHEQLRYAIQTASGWDTSTVIDKGEALGYRLSFSLDTQGYGHLAYYANKAGSGLRYADQDASGWHTETVDADLVGLSMSLALDAAGKPHISYYQIDSRTLKHAYRESASEGWRLETIAATGGLAAESSLAFRPLSAPAGGPCVAYGDTLADRLRLACRTSGGAWLSQVLADEASQALALLFTADGGLQLAHFSPQDGWLRYTYGEHPGWQSERVLQSIRLDSPVLVDTGPADRAYVLTHTSEPTRTLSLVVWGDDGWQATYEMPDLGTCEAMRLDSAGYPHLACVSPAGTLVYAFFGASGWQTQTVDHLVSSTAYASIAVNAGDEVHLSYTDDLDGHLVYGSDASGSMVTETVNAAFNGYGSSLALDSAGRPYIAYINPLGGAEITYKDPDGWQVLVPFPTRSAILQPLADSGFPSLALDCMDRIHLVYLDNSTTCRLRYVYQTAQGWRTEIIDQDPLGCAGVQPTLALDGEGNPQVAYHTEYEKTSHLKYAFKDPLGWRLQTIEIHAGEYSALAIGPGGQAWIAYLDRAHHDVKLAGARLDSYLRLPLVWKGAP